MILYFIGMRLLFYLLLISNGIFIILILRFKHFYEEFIFLIMNLIILVCFVIIIMKYHVRVFLIIGIVFEIELITFIFLRIILSILKNLAIFSTIHTFFIVQSVLMLMILF